MDKQKQSSKSASKKTAKEIEQMILDKTTDGLTSYPMGWRHIVTLIAMVGFFSMYSLRINMSVALVAMVNHSANANPNDTSSAICVRHDVTSEKQKTVVNKSASDGPYPWTSQQQGVVLSSFFYGYILTQFAGGVLAGNFGPKWVFGIGNLMTAVFTLLSPWAAEIGFSAFVFVRIMQGFCSGVTWPSMQTFFARWAPPSERSTLPAIAYAGSFMGTPLTFLLSGLLASSGLFGGWPSIFYVFAIICIVWFMIWAIFASSGPETHRFISRGEQTYIMKSLHDGSTKPALKDTPWRGIFTSSAFWATVVSHFTYNWGLYVLMTALPTYFKRVQGFDIKKNGFLSALPYLVQFVVHVSAGRFADYLRIKYNLKTVHIRKTFDCLGHLLPSICVLILAFVGCNSNFAIVMLVLTVAFTGLCSAGWFVNFLDLAPKFAGILLGVSNTFSTVPGIVGPYLTGVFTADNTIEGWQTVFFIISALYALSSVVFFIFGQGSLQPWAQFNSSNGSASSHDESHSEKHASKV